ncbi:MAG: adenylate/guanylate cyclase domain-containing protein [Chloroflexi bacterium]|nr:MAG: adenylate/guanylate cyclase domain-containing protein [Chloroflexota bacterium]
MAVSTEERRIVTVLFADMAGSTALGEQLDPEEMRSVLARYYAIARECVETYGGTVEKFIGDAVMAVFGLPTAHGDDPDRAVAAALRIRDRIQEDLLLRDRVAIRFGVSTGEVVASRDQSAGDFLITGDATNVAARLQQAAEPPRADPARGPAGRQREAAFDGKRDRTGGHRQDAPGRRVPDLAAQPGAERHRGHGAVFALWRAADLLAHAPGPVHADRH